MRVERILKRLAFLIFIKGGKELNADYIKKTIPYFLIIIIPILTVFISISIKESIKTYNILTKEIQPKGEYIITIATYQNDMPLKIESFETDSKTFYKVSRGKITKNEYINIKNAKKTQKREIKI